MLAQSECGNPRGANLDHTGNRINTIMKLRNLRDEKSLTDALWWVQRWITGSMNDANWSDPQNEFTVDQAFEYLSRTIPKTLPSVLYRGLNLIPKQGKALYKTKLLPVNPKMRFQSFTDSDNIAEEFAVGHGPVEVTVEWKPIPGLIMFTMGDLLRSKHHIIKEYTRALGDWHDQQEYVVDVQTPLRISRINLHEGEEYLMGHTR